ncbi:MAG: hypothetical protein M1812_007814 [Candelaria pacifica]|nr:MAG: hypothetical protein M1812_007814 [Candelaria pacifica]
MRNTLVRPRASIYQFCEHLSSSPKALRHSAPEVSSFRHRQQQPHSINRVLIRPSSTKVNNNKHSRAPPKPKPTAQKTIQKKTAADAELEYAQDKGQAILTTTSIPSEDATKVNNNKHSRSLPKPKPTAQETIQQKTAADAELEYAQDKGQAILTATSIPSEDAILDALNSYEILAKRLIRAPETITSSLDNAKTPTSALLSLDEKSTTKPTTPSSTPTTHLRSNSGQKAIEALSTLAARIIRHPNVFITPKILTSYISLQSHLQRPSTFAELFDLYARKPIPQPNTSPLTYKTPNPKKVQCAIPSKIANEALTSAINTKNLPLSVSIIETAFNTPAFHRSKFVKKALPPLLGFALAPVAAYTVASQISHFQDTMDPAMATNIAFVGIFSYVVFTATIGVVAVTTSNDQMNRVTWATGLPLRERWMREDERAAVDRVASAWGFKEVERRGEEEGEEWEGLREWIGMRGMVLDRVDLMDGME